MFIIFSKKKYECKKYSQLPTKFSHQGDRDILDISKITQSSSYSQNDNNTYDISTVPMYLPNGLKVYIDKVIHNVQVKDIHLNESEIPNLKDLINYLLNTDITKLATKDLEKLKNNVSHYIQLITDFLSSNTNADQNWKNLLKCLGYIDQILKKSNQSNLQQTYKEVKKHYQN